MQAITISNRFFAHELNSYSNWRQAFWRELVQNSVDAEAKSIHITTSETEDGNTLIQFQDDGPGMDESTLRDVYFQLGETTKNTTETIGGHGRARILTCFAHESYRILTQNCEVNGHGGLYDITNLESPVPGCTVEVVIAKSISEKEHLEGALTSYLETCQISCEVYINKERFTNWLHRRQATRQITFGTLHVTHKQTYRLLARVRGVTMFTSYLDCPVGLILEIDPEKARDLLPVSRDNLKYEAANELQKLSAEIAIDHQSIKRDCLENKTEVFGSLKKLERTKKTAEEQTQETNSQPNPNLESTLRTTGESTTTYHGGNSMPMQAAAFCPNPNAKLGHASISFQEVPPEETTFPEFAIHFEDAPKSLAQAAKRFDRKVISGTRLKMLRAWEAAVIFFLEEVAEESEDFAYLPGFLFSDSNEAMNVPQPGNGFLLLIQPVRGDGTLSFSIHDYEKLFSIALHECVHILCRGHNEYFASLQTQYTIKMLAKYPEFKERVRKAIALACFEDKKLKPLRKKLQQGKLPF